MSSAASVLALPPNATLDYLTNLLVGFTVGSLVVTSVSIALRIWVRTRMVACWGREDWAMLVTQCLFTAECAVLFYWASVQKTVTPINVLPTFGTLYTWLLVQETLYLIAIMSLKLSLAFFFLRYLTEGWARTVIWIGVAIYLSFTTAAVFLLIFRCGIPNDLLYKLNGGQCISNTILSGINIAWGSINTATDWIFALLPIYFIKRSRMSFAAKMSVALIMTLAVLGSAASIGRTIYAKNLEDVKNIWELWTVFLVWSVVEPGLGITAANMATLRPLLQLFADSTRSMSSRKYSSGNSSERTTGSSKRRLRLHPYGKEAREFQRDFKPASGLEFVTVKTFEEDMEGGQKATAH